MEGSGVSGNEEEAQEDGEGTYTHKHLRLTQPHRHPVTFKKINVHSNTVICCTLLTDCVMEVMKLSVNI